MENPKRWPLHVNKRRGCFAAALTTAFVLLFLAQCLIAVVMAVEDDYRRRDSQFHDTHGLGPEEVVKVLGNPVQIVTLRKCPDSSTCEKWIYDFRPPYRRLSTGIEWWGYEVFFTDGVVTSTLPPVMMM